MTIKYFLPLFCLISSLCGAQIDSISYQIDYDARSPMLKVEQHMQLHRDEASHEIYFYVWANAYKDRTTDLSQVKINQRKDDLHFAALDDRGWVEGLRFYFISSGGKEVNLPFVYEGDELVKVTVPHRKVLEINASYEIHIPSNKFTGYGRDQEGNLLLKYFFLYPEVREDGEVLKQTYKDFESLTSNIANYTVQINVPKDFEIHTDLKRYDIKEYIGRKRGFFEIAIQKKESTHRVKTPYGMVIFDRDFPDVDEVLIQKTVTNQLRFLTERLGPLTEPLYISGKSFRNNKLDGVEDVKIPIINKRYKIFFPEDRIKLQMIAQLTDAFLDRKMLVNMNQDHWLGHGLSHYLYLTYLDKELSYIPVAGKLPEDIKVGNFKPLKHLEASKILMKDRSAWVYRIILQSNFSQPVQTPFNELSNLNQKMISSVKAGLSFQYLAVYLGEDTFDLLLKEWLLQDKSNLSAQDFRIFLEQRVSKKVDWFFDDLLARKGWYDMGIQQGRKVGDSIRLTIRNKGHSSIPFKLSAYGINKQRSEWIQNAQSKFDVVIKDEGYKTFYINDSIKLPDFYLKNDFYRIDKVFTRPIRFRLVTDIPSKTTTQVFLIPEVSWNNYDKFQLGLSMSNRTPLPQSWVYRLKPKYAFGENDLTGSFDLTRNIYPRKSLFRKLNINLGGSYQHYNRGLAYKRLNLGVNGIFHKRARSTKNRTVYAFYQQIDREVRETASDEEKELKDYGLLNVGYKYWNTNLIREKKLWVNLQVSNTFSKIMGEYYLRWKFKKDKTLGVRVFGGAFFSHDLNHAAYFDFGLDRISDYTFSYPLLGRSEREGILSQQFVLAEGGFKSNFYRKSNQMLFTTNWELPIYKILDAYIDLGYLKDKDLSGEFLYDSGIRIRFIPDFLELYFPLQSSLGFEPSLGAYHERIRFMLNLDFNKFMDYWRRGKN